MIRSSQQAAYGLGYLASLTPNDSVSIDKRYEVDYSRQAQSDFNRYAQMTEAQLQREYKRLFASEQTVGRVERTSPFKREILRLWVEQPGMTHAQIAARVGCHPKYVYVVLRGARQ